LYLYSDLHTRNQGDNRGDSRCVGIDLDNNPGRRTRTIIGRCRRADLDTAEVNHAALVARDTYPDVRANVEKRRTSRDRAATEQANRRRDRRARGEPVDRAVLGRRRGGERSQDLRIRVVRGRADGDKLIAGALGSGTLDRHLYTDGGDFIFPEAKRNPEPEENNRGLRLELALFDISFTNCFSFYIKRNEFKVCLLIITRIILAWRSTLKNIMSEYVSHSLLFEKHQTRSIIFVRRKSIVPHL